MQLIAKYDQFVTYKRLDKFVRCNQKRLQRLLPMQAQHLS